MDCGSKNAAGAAYPSGLAGAKSIELRWSTQPAHPFLMLTGLHGPDVIRPLKRSCLPKSGSTRKRPCFHSWQPYGCESGISRGIGPNGPGAQATRRHVCLSFFVSPCEKTHRGPGTTITDSQSSWSLGVLVRQARSVAQLAAWPSQYWEFLFRHHRGD
jgi:hypothetical protein